VERTLMLKPISHGALMFVLSLLFCGCEETNEPPLTELKPAHLRVAPDGLGFGIFPIGFSASKEITLYNSGQIKLRFESITLEEFSDSFSLSPTIAEIEIKDSLILTLEFSPTLPQSFETRLLFNFDGDNSPLSIPVSGMSIDNPLCAPCDSSPPSYCIDENVLAIYEKATESCGEGQCLFVAQDVLCHLGCDLQTQSCTSLDAGIENTITTPPQETPEDAGGVDIDDGGLSQNTTPPLYTNSDGGLGFYDSGANGDTLNIFSVAQGNLQTCYHCAEWDNPTSCSVSSHNCSLIQTTGFGQEKDHPQASPLSFTLIDGESLFKDNNTGFIWSRCANGSLVSPCDTNTQRQNLSSAQALCTQRTPYLDQHFRLPSVGEILTLINYQSETHGLAQDHFELPQDAYWTATPVDPLNPLSNYWTLNTLEEKLSENTVQNQAQVLCVTGTGYGTALLSTTHEMVNDARTQLTWQKCRHGQNENTAGVCSGTVIQLPFHEALNHCESLDFGSHLDWRLPSIRELTTLALYSEDPNLNDEFGELGLGLLGQHWSATPHLTTAAIWIFNPGATFWQKGGSSQPLRCVRSP
jgi:hypothetical protein